MSATTLGIDMAAQPRNTAACAIEWEHDVARVTCVEADLDERVPGEAKKEEDWFQGEVMSSLPGARRLVSLIGEQQRKYTGKPTFDEVTEVVPLAPVRTARSLVSSDRAGAFKRSAAYEGWKRSMYQQVWFDSSTERNVANVLDEADEVEFWVRLHRGDLPILWTSGNGWYNPDFIVVETDGSHWVVEVKMDKEVQTTTVQEKREAARRWANHVSADPKVGKKWGYLLVSETHVRTARGSWPSLKELGRA